MAICIINIINTKGGGMNFGDKKKFCPYLHCRKTWGLMPNEITNVERKRTYKKFVEYTVHWENCNGKGIHKFKVILNDIELEDM